MALGGKNAIINTDAMNRLADNGSAYIKSAKECINSIDQIVTEMRELSLVGKKGLVCRQALNSITSITNDLARSTEKIAVYMEAKIKNQNPLKKQEEQQNLEKQKMDKDIFINIKR